MTSHTLDLFGPPPPGGEPDEGRDWPPPERFPLNREGLRVQDTVVADLSGGTGSFAPGGQSFPEEMERYWLERGLVEGPEALVDAATYAHYREVGARVVARVSVVPADTPWAFFCLAGSGDRAPQWVLFPAPEERIAAAVLAWPLLSRFRCKGGTWSTMKSGTTPPTGGRQCPSPPAPRPSTRPSRPCPKG